MTAVRAIEQLFWRRCCVERDSSRSDGEQAQSSTNIRVELGNQEAEERKSWLAAGER